jgi:hypothetical protein
MLTGKTRRLNPAGLSCEECQRRSSLLTFILRESGRAERDCEVVQCNQGLWFYSTGRRNKGRVRPYLVLIEKAADLKLQVDESTTTPDPSPQASSDVEPSPLAPNIRPEA